MTLIYQSRRSDDLSHHQKPGLPSSLRVVKYPMLRDPPNTRICIGVVGEVVSRVWWSGDREIASKSDVS